MQYNEESFLAGIALGKQLKGWSANISKLESKIGSIKVNAYASLTSYKKHDISDSVSVNINGAINASLTETFVPTNPPKQILDNVSTDIVIGNISAAVWASLVSNNPPLPISSSVSADVEVGKIIAAVRDSIEKTTNI